ncbi:MAG TPA: hypothetical protein VFG68_19030 [Fimbriiglobus sp.]|nr:hypothetical protein [Fimbriiglobus sp.]
MAPIADELRKLAELREAGSLTADEYLEAKALVLAGRPAAPADGGRTNYGPATAAFILGLVGLPFAWIGVIPIAAFITGLCALGGCDEKKHKNGWMAMAGGILGILGFLAMLSAYKYI